MTPKFLLPLLTLLLASVPALAVTLSPGESIVLNGTTVSCGGGYVPDPAPDPVPAPAPIRVISSFCRCGGFTNRVLQKVQRYSDGTQSVDDLHEFTSRPGRNWDDCVAALPTWPGC